MAGFEADLPATLRGSSRKLLILWDYMGRVCGASERDRTSDLLITKGLCWLANW